MFDNTLIIKYVCILCTLIDKYTFPMLFVSDSAVFALTRRLVLHVRTPHLIECYACQWTDWCELPKVFMSAIAIGCRRVQIIQLFIVRFVYHLRSATVSTT